MPTIQRLAPEQWKLFRAVRLTALRDTPDAFGSTLERELAFIEDDWKQRLERDDCRTYVAFSEDLQPIGLIVGAPYERKKWGQPNVS